MVHKNILSHKNITTLKSLPLDHILKNIKHFQSNICCHRISLVALLIKLRFNYHLITLFDQIVDQIVLMSFNGKLVTRNIQSRAPQPSKRTRRNAPKRHHFKHEPNSEPRPYNNKFTRTLLQSLSFGSEPNKHLPLISLVANLFLLSFSFSLLKARRPFFYFSYTQERVHLFSRKKREIIEKNSHSFKWIKHVRFQITVTVTKFQFILRRKWSSAKSLMNFFL